MRSEELVETIASLSSILPRYRLVYLKLSHRFFFPAFHKAMARHGYETAHPETTEQGRKILSYNYRSRFWWWVGRGVRKEEAEWYLEEGSETPVKFRRSGLNAYGDTVHYLSPDSTRHSLSLRPVPKLDCHANYLSHLATFICNPINQLVLTPSFEAEALRVAPLMLCHRLDFAGETELLGRRAVVFNSRPRSQQDLEDRLYWVDCGEPSWVVGDAYRLWIEPATGVLLKQQAFWQSQLFAESFAEELEVDNEDAFGGDARQLFSQELG